MMKKAGWSLCSPNDATASVAKNTMETMRWRYFWNPAAEMLEDVLLISLVAENAEYFAFIRDKANCGGHDGKRLNGLGIFGVR